MLTGFLTEFQGLADTEELVISKTLTAMTELAEMNLFRKQMLYELTAETISLLYHPVSVTS